MGAGPVVLKSNWSKADLLMDLLVFVHSHRMSTVLEITKISEKSGEIKRVEMVREKSGKSQGI